MKTLHTITLAASGTDGAGGWKVFFPFDNDGIRAKLEGFGLHYAPHLRASMLPNTDGLVAKLRAAFENLAFVTVKNAKDTENRHPPTTWDKPPINSANAANLPSKPNITASPMTHKGEARIKLETPYAPEYIRPLRTIEGATWSKTNRCWHLPKTKEAWAALNALFEVAIEKPAPTAGTAAEQDQAASLETEPARKITVTTHPKRTDIIGLRLPKELKDEHLATIRNIHGRRWNPDAMIWEIPNTKLTMRFLEKYLVEHLHWTFKPDMDNLPEHLDAAPKPQFLSKEGPKAKYEAAVVALEQCLLLKRFSYRTIKSYKNCFRNFILHYNDIKPSEITRAQMDGYIHFLIKEKHITESFQNQVVSALLHFYLDVVKQEEKVERLFRPKKPQKLPHVLTEEEVVRLLNCVDNLKHKIILMLIYSAGLRLSEVVNLRIPDLQPEHNRLFVREGKGKKDRCTILSEKVKAKLLDYYEQYQPCGWLFEGQSGGQYSVRSVQAIFEMAKNKSKINQYATVHTLRHSFATHLLEKGVDLRYIQDLLGHESSKTTEIYTHITKKGIDKISSPLDHLDI